VERFKPNPMGINCLHFKLSNSGAKRHGVSEPSIYAWRKKFGDLGTDDVKRLKQLEQENSRLKKLVVERDLEIEVMKEIAANKR